MSEWDRVTESNGNDSDTELTRFRPVVCVGYGPRCVPVMQLAEAAAGLCELVWMVDGSLPEMQEMRSLLERFGPVIDISALSVAELIRQVTQVHPDGVLTYLDAGMVVCAEVAAALALPFHTVATAELLVDKARQREALFSAGLPGPRSVVVPEGPGAEAVVAAQELARTGGRGEVTWPAVLKPRSAQGSRYTFLVHDAHQVAELLDSMGANRLPMVLEEYLPGDPTRSGGPYADYVSVETLVSRGRISHLAITGRFPPAENFRETGFFIPADLTPGDQQQVLQLTTQAIHALGITVGCLHTEIKFTTAGPRILEVNGRVGGGVPEMLDRAAGIPLLELTLRVALGEEMKLSGPVPTEGIGYRFFLQPPSMSTTVTAIEGVDALSDLPSVDTVSVHQKPGANLDWRDGSRNHILAVVGSARDHSELLAVERFLHHDVSVSYESLRS